MRLEIARKYPTFLIIPMIGLSLIITTTLTSCSNATNSSAKATTALALDDPARLNDMVITLLMPQIANAVKNFYEPYLTVVPTVVPYFNSKITQIQGGEGIHEGAGNSHYIVTVEVMPYTGPHDPVGKDRVTLDLQMDEQEGSRVAVKNYEHVKSYTLPPNLQSLLKKPLP